MDITYENYSGYCQVIDYCESLNINMDVSKCLEDCNSITKNNKYLINTCNSFSFNQFCFDKCLEENDNEWCQACNTSCLFPESLPENIANYTYCQILPEYKQLSPCSKGIDNIDCTEQSLVAYCENNNVYCSYIEGNDYENKIMNTCECQCMPAGKMCRLQYCKNTPYCY
jgi:hypothetical protein